MGAARSVEENAAVLSDALMERGWSPTLKGVFRIGGPDPVVASLFVKPPSPRPPRGQNWPPLIVRVHTDGRIEIVQSGPEEPAALRQAIRDVGLGSYLRGRRTMKELRALGYDYWKEQPALKKYHFANLVYVDGRIEVTVSRMTLADYDNNRQTWLRERLSVEPGGILPEYATPL